MKIRLTISLFFLVLFQINAQENAAVKVNLKNESADKIDFTETNIGLTFKKELSPKTGLKNTLEYSNLNVNYDSKNYGAFQIPDRLQQLQNKLEISQKITNTTKLNFEVIPTVNFERNLNSDDFTLLGSFEIQQQLNEKTTFSAGAARSAAFGNPKFLPVAAFQYKINDKTKLVLGFPDSEISYSNNDRNKFSLDNRFNGNFYNLNVSNYADAAGTKAVTSQMTTSFNYERNVDKNWFLNFKAGYDFDKKYILTDNQNHTLHDFNIGNSYVLGIGIKYKQ
ncbi:DUF6268 family outer membrane beta-barrel protein [Flavobacterium gelatinilyticum]|uniref:DUF6268 family outer membrane beta-barrel protein n=1 Tax=Flavobacterium gelatinilyticum TaxID=3003260 RepID=UPI0024817F19|nr:DUF6268 family outer membrane beta-barrel protein [Flavobacterium gelatinilyticum]